MAHHLAGAITGIDTHAHVFLHDLPMVAGRRYTPDYDAPLERYLELLERNGLSHGVLIQPSFLGTDNSFLVDALRRHPQQLRGVAVVAPEITDSALDSLAEAGVVGVRLNLIGEPPRDCLAPRWLDLYSRLRRRGMQVEIQCPFDELHAILPTILDTGVTVVIDHFGLPRHDPAPREAWLALLGHAALWVKLSAPYRSASDLPRARQLLQCLRASAGGIDRLLWGSDWPHTRFEQQTDFSAQRAFVEALLPEPAELHRVLVDNPARLFGFQAEGESS